jgi:hypothetical protein
MDALKSDVERTTPNLKASDQYDALVEKERAVTEEFEAVRQEEEDKIDKFKVVKQERYGLFMDAFKNISGNIDKTNKQLTKSNTHLLVEMRTYIWKMKTIHFYMESSTVLCLQDNGTAAWNSYLVVKRLLLRLRCYSPFTEIRDLVCVSINFVPTSLFFSVTNLRHFSYWMKLMLHWII